MQANYDDVIGTRTAIIIGNRTTRNDWNDEELCYQIMQAIDAVHFNFDFYFSYTNEQERKEYRALFTAQFIDSAWANPGGAFAELFEWNDGAIIIKPTLYLTKESRIDAWFSNHSKMSAQLKKDYANYRTTQRYPIHYNGVEQ